MNDPIKRYPLEFLNDNNEAIAKTAYYISKNKIHTLLQSLNDNSGQICFQKAIELFEFNPTMIKEYLQWRQEIANSDMRDISDAAKRDIAKYDLVKEESVYIADAMVYTFLVTPFYEGVNPYSNTVNYNDIMYNQNNFQENMMKDLKKCKERFALVYLTINSINKDWKHANILIIDIKQKIFYLFEPLLNYKRLNITNKKIDLSIRKVLFDNLINDGYTYINLFEKFYSSCDKESCTLQGKTLDKYCASWTIYFMLLFVLNVDDQDLIIEYLGGEQGQYIIKNFIYNMYLKFKDKVDSMNEKETSLALEKYS